MNEAAKEFWEDDVHSTQAVVSDVSASDALARITTLGERMLSMETKIAGMKSDLEDAERAYRKIEQEELPGLMKEVNMTEFKLTDGTKLSIVPDVQCSTSQERMPQIVDWLTTYGFDGIVKTSIKVEYGRGEFEAAKETAASLSESLGRPVDLSQTIHPQTLKSFVKERMADATEGAPAIPLDLFAVRPFDRAKLTKAKKR